jgi:hypothetical protein
LALAVVAIVGLAADLAVAGQSSYQGPAQASVTLVGHRGHHGHSHGYRSYRYGHCPPRHHYYYHHYRRPAVIVAPPVYAYPPTVYPRVYSRYYHPYGGFHYRGPGFGISIGF